jgi:hypothetical protein
MHELSPITVAGQAAPGDEDPAVREITSSKSFQRGRSIFFSIRTRRTANVVSPPLPKYPTRRTYLARSAGCHPQRAVHADSLAVDVVVLG